MAIAIPDVTQPAIAPVRGDAPLDAPIEGPAPAETGAFRSIVVPYDGSSPAHAALDRACALAGRSGAGVTLMHAVEPVRVPEVPDMSVELALSLGETDAHAMLNDAAQRVRAAGVPVTEILVMPPEGESPSTPQAILTTLRAADADLLVMATHGRTGAARAVLGSVADAVVRRAPIPVLLLNHAAAAAEGWPDANGGLAPSVLVGLCGDEISESVLRPAASLALALGAGVELVCVVPERYTLVGQSYGVSATKRGTECYLSRQADALLTTEPRLHFVRTSVLVSEPHRMASTIAEHARLGGAQAIALATHARSGLARLLLGSVTSGVVAAASVPVLVVPPGAANNERAR